MDKDKILDYVRKTPANTNPNVLKTMLNDSGSEINPGYSCTEITTLLTDESVTTVFDDVMNSGILAYSTSIDADTIRVTFDGTEYTCNAEEALAGKTYGAPMGEEGVDWSEYPFQIASGLRNDLYTESAGTYQIKIETVEEVVETTPCFEKAVNSVIGGSGSSTGPLIIHQTEEEVKDPQTQETIGYKTDALASDVYAAWQNGRLIYYFDRPDEDAEGWLVSRVCEMTAVIFLVDFDDNDSLTFKILRKSDDDGYLYLEVLMDDDEPKG